MKTKRAKKMARVGVIGLVGTLVLNLFAVLALTRASATFFSDQWWTGWFPCYLLWFTFTIIGTFGCLKQKPDDTKADA